MSIAIEEIQQCESLVASGRTSKAIEVLLKEKDQTAYKQELLSISNRWRKLDRESMANVLSDSERAVQEGKVNRSLLLLLTVLTREYHGEKPSPVELANLRSETASSPKKKVVQWIPWIVTALALGVLAWQLSLPTTHVDCAEVAQIDGDWKITLITVKGNEEQGQATIRQNACNGYFTISGQVDLEADDLIFSSRIGGIHDGEILFVYENLNGEIGLCRGVLSGLAPDSFSLHYYDIEGFDQQEDSGGRMHFSRIKDSNSN